ncbi:MAG: polymerase, sigma-24 subunit, subfamily [Myxococcales bacterium]|nr:polymerase, sigma-24 subunit, subfamily [Myxococcales bacterium]
MADDDVTIFEQHRGALKALAYRMLGDTASAEDVVQEAWIRWQGREVQVENPRSYLLTVATRLCLNVLGSARARREEPRTWLPEPIDVEDQSSGLGLEVMEQVSMAFLVALQRLSPAERAVLLMHDVFDMTHAEIAKVLDKTEAASRQVLKRAKQGVTEAREVVAASHDDHRRMLRAFAEASRTGNVAALTALLAEDAVLITDGGRSGVRVGRVRNLNRPFRGAKKIASVVARSWQAAPEETREYVLNGQPAIVAFRDGRPFAALFLAIANGKIVQIFIQADRDRLGRIVVS